MIVFHTLLININYMNYLALNKSNFPYFDNKMNSPIYAYKPFLDFAIPTLFFPKS